MKKTKHSAFYAVGGRTRMLLQSCILHKNLCNKPWTREKKLGERSLIFDDNRHIHSIEQLYTDQILNISFGFEPSIYIKNIGLIKCYRCKLEFLTFFDVLPLIKSSNLKQS